MEKVSKIQVLTILALIVVFVLLFPIPMSRSREELYMTTETYYDEVPQITSETISVPYAVNETILIPYQIVKYMHWQVTWRVLTIDRQWGPVVGTQEFPSTFWFNWGTGTIYGGMDDGIGFTAEASFYQEDNNLYTFTLGSDDGTRLRLDGNLLIDAWYDQAFQKRSAITAIGSGWHTLRIDYYEWTYTAQVFFDCDKLDLFTWEETQYLSIQIPRIYYSAVEIPRIQVQQVPKQRTTVANRTVTETIYSSLLEYLMKGGKV